MPSKIKLTYFNVRGRAEISRLILAQAGVAYEDHRLPREEWPSMKPNTPCGVLPVLEYNGTTIAQSISIARFLAKEYNLAGKNRVEEAQADMIVDCVSDVLNSVVQIFREKDETKKAEITKTFQTEGLPNAMKMFEKLLSANGGKFFVGKELTWADLAFADFFSGLEARYGEAIFGDHKSLKEHIHRVMSLPNIKKWVENRPKTEM